MIHILALMFSISMAQTPPGTTCTRSYQAKCFDSIFANLQKGDGESAWQELSAWCRGGHIIACQYLAKVEFVLNKPTATATLKKNCKSNQVYCLEEIEKLTNYGWAKEMNDFEKEICQQNLESEHCRHIMPRTQRLDRLIQHYALNVGRVKKQASEFAALASINSDKTAIMIDFGRSLDDLELSLKPGSHLKISLSGCTPPVLSILRSDDFFSFMNCNVMASNVSVRIIGDYQRLQNFVKGFLPDIPLARSVPVFVVMFNKSKGLLTVGLE